MKKRILAFVLATVITLSLVACGGSETTGNETNKDANKITEKDTTVATESENSETVIDYDAWQNMTVTIEGGEVIMGESLNMVNTKQSLLRCESCNGQNPYGWAVAYVSILDMFGDEPEVYPARVSEAFLYFPTNDTAVFNAHIYEYDFALSLETIYAANRGEAEIPEIILPNGLKVGTRVAGDGSEELNDLYGVPLEVNNTGADYEYGTEHVYANEDDTKRFYIYTAGNYVIGFKMWINYETQDWYVPQGERQ